MAIRTMEVGVETFSLTLKRRERTENEQMSTPLPATELKMPPRKPTARRTAACQAPNLDGQKENETIAHCKKCFIAPKASAEGACI